MQMNEKSKGPILKVLIADDDTPTRILLKAAISQWGYEIIEAKDGQEAWDLLKEKDAPRLLIVDWLMPKMDGITLCEKSKTELNFRTYIILLTQMSGTTNLIKALDAGADEFLSKPFNMAELRSRLSIAARIVKYENEITQQNTDLKKYKERTSDLTSSLLNMAKQIDTQLASETVDTSKARQKILTMMERLEKFHVTADEE